MWNKTLGAIALWDSLFFPLLFLLPLNPPLRFCLLFLSSPCMVYSRKQCRGFLSNSCSKLRFLQGIFSPSIWHSSDCVWQHLPCSTALQLHLTLGSHPHSLPACLLRKMFSQQRWRREYSEGKQVLYFPMRTSQEPTKCLIQSFLLKPVLTWTFTSHFWMFIFLYFHTSSTFKGFLIYEKKIATHTFYWQCF